MMRWDLPATRMENTGIRFMLQKLRIEKLDSETGENILHDDAVFAIYAASRDTVEVQRGGGAVL